MAWRPYEQLKAGELDNTVPGKVTGWLEFAGIDGRVVFDLKGDFHRDIRGAKIALTGAGTGDPGYMNGLNPQQTGKVGDITAGLPPHDWGRSPYIEWYADDNGRVVLELDPSQVEVIGQPIPVIESDPVDRVEQAQHMGDFMRGMCQKLNEA